jgi:hypothetical protein
LALDAETGRVLWGCDAPAARLGLPPPSGRFQAHYPAGEKRLLVQTGGGRTRVLDAATGHTLHELPTAGSPRAAAWLPLDERRVWLVAGPRRVVLLDVVEGRELAAHELAGSLTGEQPQLVGGRADLFLFSPRNYAWTLQRLDPATGRSLWPAERILCTTAVDAGRMALDARAVYLVEGNVLRSCALAEAGPGWALLLSGPDGRWQVALRDGCVVAYPFEWESIHTRVRRLFGPVEAHVLAQVLPAQEPQRYPVVFCDAKTGRLVQQLNLTVDPSSRRSGEAPRGWYAPAVLFSRRSVVVALPSKACRWEAVARTQQ